VENGETYASATIKALAKKYGFNMNTPVRELPRRVMDIILYGTCSERITVQHDREYGGGSYTSAFEGLVNLINRRYRETSSEGMKRYYESFMTSRTCPRCNGKRLRDEVLAVTVGRKNIHDITSMPVSESSEFFSKITLPERERLISDQVLKELQARLGFLKDVGLGYLTLARSAGTLSGGEAQRIRLATQIGSGLMGVIYILDEPSIGLHQRDNGRLLNTLRKMRDLGNTLIVVEHDEETMYAADHIIDMGPGAGGHGGMIIAAGTVEEIKRCDKSITGQYLSGKKSIPVPAKRRTPDGKWLTVKGARENNLKNIDVTFPLGVFTCVTGVSGSGKSSLVNEILFKKLATLLNNARRKAGDHDAIDGVNYLDKVINIDQSPIGRTPRSNPATYTGVFDFIRQLFAATSEARARGYKPGRFSFNVKGGRCEACSGDGIIKIEMHFLPDVYVPCEVCKGKRYNRETLEVTYKGKNIAEVLDMTVDGALEFFESIPRINNKIKTLQDVGLGYIKLGQPSTTLSGGEAQRVKLATELSRRSTGNTLYILDEPTTGLHMADVHRLVNILQRLVKGGNTVVVIEHNMDVVKTADYIIDLGPEGGDKGGYVIAEGTPEEVAANKGSYTGHYLVKVLGTQKPDKGKDMGTVRQLTTSISS
jgi:excinuclease ABC subunit A